MPQTLGVLLEREHRSTDASSPDLGAGWDHLPMAAGGQVDPMIASRVQGRLPLVSFLDPALSQSPRLANVPVACRPVAPRQTSINPWRDFQRWPMGRVGGCCSCFLRLPDCVYTRSGRQPVQTTRCKRCEAEVAPGAFTTIVVGSGAGTGTSLARDDLVHNSSSTIEGSP